METVDSFDFDVWGLPLLMMAGALIVGLYFALRTDVVEEEGDVQDELMAQKARHMESLRELEADKEKLVDAVYLREKERLLFLAENVVRQLEEGVDETILKSREWGSSTRTDMGTVFFLVVGCLIAFGMYRYTKDRGEGETMTGASMEAQVASYKQTLIDARKSLEVDPKNLDALHLLTYNALLNRQLQVAMSHIEVVREITPDDPELRIHMGILKLAIQSYDQALEDFNASIAENPNMGKAYLWRALLYSNKKENEKALADAKKALPMVTLIEEKRFLSSLMDELERPPPILSGIVEIANPSKGVVFVIARRAKEGGGPPVAVGRYMPSESLSFALGKGEMVMGGVWPEEIWLEARLDADGNVMTKDDARASVVQGPIKGEQTDIVIQIAAGSESPSLENEISKEEVATPIIKGELIAEGETPGGVIFVIARRSEGAKGPPVAVKRLDSGGFPLAFTMDEGDLMMGGTWPNMVWLEARLDTDGNAMTKTDQDWYSGGISVQGTQSVSLILKKK